MLPCALRSEGFVDAFWRVPSICLRLKSCWFHFILLVVETIYHWTCFIFQGRDEAVLRSKGKQKETTGLAAVLMTHPICVADFHSRWLLALVRFVDFETICIGSFYAATLEIGFTRASWTCRYVKR